MPTIPVRFVADYILLAMRRRGENISNLKLQKLVYYAQAWHLARAGTPLFAERIEAWVHGPVVPSLFQDFKRFRWDEIDCEITAPILPAGVSRHLDNVLNAYAHLSATQLEGLTHRESPWLKARGGIPHDESSTAVISTERMGQFYSSLDAKCR